jgi:putative ABC transport system permease protein
VATGFQGITDTLSRLPGVATASATSSLPLDGGGSYLGRVFLREGQPEPPASQDTAGQWSVIQPGYFATLGLRMVQGRPFNERDIRESTPVIIISRNMARQMFPNENPLGRRIRSWRDENVYREIVGVVDDLRYSGLSENIGNNVYVPHSQNTWSSLMLVVRTQGDPGPLAKSIRSAIWSIDRKLTIADLKTMDEIVAEAMSRPCFLMFLMGIFAALALLLAAIGLYGVVSYSVTQRTREIGIRMALGAARKDVLRIVAGRVAVLAGAGVLFGLAGAMALTRLMRVLLFGVSPTDAVTFAAVAALLVVVALAASWLPARRAARVDPVVALRYE